ncbi:hypothetical protein FRC11_004910 [Ceratobasidium sp. 423]|nr:hypothetical protein FRC11_004910 [Ceratobasidium sp. 423]
MSDNPTGEFIDWDAHVHTEAFDKACNAQYKRLSSGSSSSESSRLKLWDDDSSSHIVPKLEAHLYYHGIRGDRERAPKLVYRTSKDVFTPPSGPAQYVRTMEVFDVDFHEKLSKNDLWRIFLGEVVKLLESQQIRFTSVDFVRFRWVEGDGKSPRKTVTSRPTIWVGVLPDSTTGDAAFHSAQEILQLLKSHGIEDIDVAYRESTARFLANSPLLAPFNNLNPLKDVADWITTALSLPIAGLKTLYMQGTLGFYFIIGEDLYGVTARHVLFPEDQGNYSYTYNPSGPKKEVVVMGTQAFDDFLASIQAKIGNLNNSLTALGKQAASFERRANNGNQQAALDLAATRENIRKTEETVEEHRKFFARMKKDWSEVDNRVIGHVVWAPPITGLVDPHGYTLDVCVIRLDKSKFDPNFKGNVVDLGPEIDSGAFMSKMYPRDDAQSEFDYPAHRLFKLTKIMTAAQVKAPNSLDIKGDPVRYVIKRGHTTFTTIGRLSGFESHTRHYGLLGTFDSIETVVFPYNNHSGPFSKGGDSGALIVGPEGEFVALLTGGTGPTDSSDITYGTLMVWLWEIIKAEFPGTNLYFEIAED